jgi:hypothetical protein
VLVRDHDVVPWLAAHLLDEERSIPGTGESLPSPLRAEATAFLYALGAVLSTGRDALNEAASRQVLRAAA